MKYLQEQWRLRTAFGIGSLFAVFFSGAQELTAQEKALFSAPEIYGVPFSSGHITIDGKADEGAWKTALWSKSFTDIEGDLKPAPALQTRMKMLWSDSCLYVFAEMEEPHVWANLRRHDAVIFHDNDFEIFIDPFNSTQNYLEVEVNAFNTIFDLMMGKPYRNSGSAMIGYNVEGLQSAVFINGSVNNPADRDSGWTVEMAIPFSALTLGNDVHVPADGEQWRINFSRVEWDTEIKENEYVKKKEANGKQMPERNWVWSPQGVINMHYPERWGYLQFNKSNNTTATRPRDESLRNQLWLAYYRQKNWYKQHGKYAGTLSELGITKSDMNLEATAKQFLCSIDISKDVVLVINQDGYIRVIKQE